MSIPSRLDPNAGLHASLVIALEGFRLLDVSAAIDGMQALRSLTHFQAGVSE